MIRFTNEGPLDGPTNMIRDKGILGLAEEGSPSCRIYRWQGPWISLGRFQCPERDLIEGSSVPWVVRPTGGKAVLHGHDITVALAIPLSMLATENVSAHTLSRSIRTVYMVVAGPLIGALRECGVPAALAANTRYSTVGARTADCFSHVSPNDIVDENTGQKICGCALRLTHGAVMVQASIPNGEPLVDPQLSIRNAQPAQTASWDNSRFSAALFESLRHILGVPV